MYCNITASSSFHLIRFVQGCPDDSFGQTLQELQTTVTMDQGKPVVAVLGERKVRVGQLQAIGKRKARTVQRFLRHWGKFPSSVMR